MRLLEGRSLLALGDNAGAVAALAESVRLSPQPDRMMWLAEAQLAAGRREDAAETARGALLLVPGDEHAEDILAEAEGRAVEPPPPVLGVKPATIEAPGVAE